MKDFPTYLSGCVLPPALTQYTLIRLMDYKSEWLSIMSSGLLSSRICLGTETDKPQQQRHRINGMRRRETFPTHKMEIVVVFLDHQHSLRTYN